MKITFDWLKDHLNTNLKEEKLLEQLTNIGLEVESLENSFAELELYEMEEPQKTLVFGGLIVSLGPKQDCIQCLLREMERPTVLQV